MGFPAVAIAVTVALLTSFASTAVYSTEDFTAASNLRLKSSTAGLCAVIIEPSGFPCIEHTTRTKDGYVLGLQRVSSPSVIVQERSSPVLLVHGLFMIVWTGLLNAFLGGGKVEEQMCIMKKNCFEGNDNFH